ncbi:MAG: ATP-binding protein [Nostoc sp.]|uniref:ATP-binding protein n=1 Tax=Nostoc sp. TaxID=1180 RepID=UPI002FFA1236
MSNQRPFPLELLQKPSSEKLTYFKGITVPHKNLKEVSNVLKTNILEPADTSLFLVFGSTGIGKTTLRLRLEKLILEEFLEELRQNPGLIAVAGVEVNSPAQGKFNQSDYYIRVLESLNEVLISYKVDYAIYDDLSGGLKPVPKTKQNNAAALRRSMEKAFTHRQLKAFMVDEAQHLFAMAGGHQLLNQMNWIKSIANLTKTVHVLFGTYELLNCSTVNGQVGRRSQDIHLARYHKEFPQDLAEYSRVIQTFQRYCPLPKEPQLENHCEYFIDYSLGCIGILKNWFVRALRISLEEDAKTLILQHFQKTELSPARRKQIRQEAESGEKRLEELLKDDEEFYNSNSNKKKSTQSRNQRLGERKPQRDPVGIDSYEN